MKEVAPEPYYFDYDTYEAQEKNERIRDYYDEEIREDGLDE